MELSLPIKILIIVFTTLFMMFIMLYSIMAIAIFAPSETTSKIIVENLTENNLTKFIPLLYMSEAELEVFLSTATN